MKRLTLFLLLCAPSAWCQANSGELHVTVTGPSGRGMQTTVSLLSEANQYRSNLETNLDGELVVQWLPYGIYRLTVEQPGFAPVAQDLTIQSRLPLHQLIRLKLPTVKQTVTVKAANTLIDPEEPGSVVQLGASFIQHRVGSIPGRSLQDLVNSQPGWLYEGNAVLHPRGSEYQTQFVIDGIPLTDNRSPSFGPEIEADDVQSMSIYTAGFAAEYGRKMGGVVELNTAQNWQAGLHGDVILAGGSFDTASGFAKGQYAWGRNALGGSASGSRTDRYLNPVVPQN